jgi:hypothetical protein
VGNAAGRLTKPVAVGENAMRRPAVQ